MLKEINTEESLERFFGELAENGFPEDLKKEVSTNELEVILDIYHNFIQGIFVQAGIDSSGRPLNPKAIELPPEQLDRIENFFNKIDPILSGFISPYPNIDKETVTFVKSDI